MDMPCLYVLLRFVLVNQPAPMELPAVLAPIVYKDLMLIISDSDSVTAIIFDEDVDTETDKGVRYKYRCLHIKDGKVDRGSGIVAERRKYKKTDNEALDIDSNLTIRAGKSDITWGYQAAGRGWIYYYPEKLSVHLAHRRDFAEIRLERFKRK